MPGKRDQVRCTMSITFPLTISNVGKNRGEAFNPAMKWQAGKLEVEEGEYSSLLRHPQRSAALNRQTHRRSVEQQWNWRKNMIIEYDGWRLFQG